MVEGKNVFTLDSVILVNKYTAISSNRFYMLYGTYLSRVGPRLETWILDLPHDPIWAIWLAVFSKFHQHNDKTFNYLNQFWFVVYWSLNNKTYVEFWQKYNTLHLENTSQNATAICLPCVKAPCVNILHMVPTDPHSRLGGHTRGSQGSAMPWYA